LVKGSDRLIAALSLGQVKGASRGAEKGWVKGRIKGMFARVKQDWPTRRIMQISQEINMRPSTEIGRSAL
jgi:hypothetical protein